jgi:hypothetical protein
LIQTRKTRLYFDTPSTHAARQSARHPVAGSRGIVMQVSVFEFVVDKFASGETDFLPRLDSDPFIRQAFIDEIIVPIVNVIRSVNDGAMLTVAGHSDRVDTPGLSHFNCLAQEKSASEARSNSALAGIQALVQQMEPIRCLTSSLRSEPPAPASWCGTAPRSPKTSGATIAGCRRGS